MKPIISIIIPVYNVENYLHRCLDSVIGQTFKDIEIILVDDGSTDKSGEICDYYAKKDDRITVIHKENGGLSDARNTGIDISKGKYISFIDSDDWIDVNMMKELYTLLEINNADIAECKYIKSKQKNSLSQPHNEIIILNNIESSKSLYKDDWYGSIVVWNKLYNKDLFKKIRFPKGKLNEDQFTTPKLYLEANKIVFTNQIYYYYYQSSNSITRSDFSLKKLDSLESLKETKKMYIENNQYELSKLVDETYSYALIKYYNLIKKNNHSSDIKNKIFEEYKLNFMGFMRNDFINWKYKIYLLIFRINPYFMQKF